MSSQDATSLEIAELQGYFTENCLGLTVMTIIAFEYILTLRQELDYFWKRKFTGASVLFFMTRYLALAVNIIETSGFSNITPKMCTPYVRAGSILSALQYLPWGAFSAMRVYALSRRGLPLSILVFLLSLVPLGFKLGTQPWIIGVFDPIVGCEGAATYSAAFGKQLTISTRTCLIAADLITIAVTWYATYSTTRLAPADSPPSFATTLLQDGLLYFIVLLTLNTLHLLFTMLSIVRDSQSPVSYLTIFTEPLTAVLIARFLLDLQATERSAVNASASDDNDSPGVGGALTSPASLVFGRFVGSLGSSVLSTYAEAAAEGEGEAR